MKRKFPVFKIVAAVLLVLIGAVFIWKISIRSANRQRLNAIAARGEPVSLAELDKFYKAVPDQENAALLWLAGVSMVTPDPDDSYAWGSIVVPRRATEIEEQQLQRARELISSNQQALAIFHRAAALSKSRYPVSFSTQFVDLPHLAKVRLASTVLRAEAFVAVAEGNTGRSVAALNGMLAAGRSLAFEPTILSQLVHYAIDTFAVHTLQFVVNNASLTESNLLDLAQGFARADDPESLALGLIGERASFIFRMSDLKGSVAADAAAAGIEVQNSVAENVFHWPLVRTTGFFERDMRFGIDALTTNIAFARLPDPQKSLSKTNSADIAARAKSGYYILSGLFLPVLEKAFLRDSSHRAHIRVAQLVLAIERFRLANNGKLPDQLSSLVPTYLDKTPVDPFDGQPIRYKRTDKGYVVYSIGADEKDDGGAERIPNAPKGSPEDVTFIVDGKSPIQKNGAKPQR